MASSPAPQEAVAQYIDEIDLAVRSVHAAVQQESGRIRSLRAQLGGAEARIVEKGERLQFLDSNPDLDDEGLGSAARWELHFNDLPENDRIGADLEEARERFRAAAFSVSVLCGALLQVAKQAISVAEEGPPTAFRGRRIHGLPVGEVVWESRNQSMHFEEGAWSDGVKRVFKALDREHPGEFVLSRGVNHAHRVFDELRWHDFERLKADLREMTGLTVPSADTVSRSGGDR